MSIDLCKKMCAKTKMIQNEISFLPIIENVLLVLYLSDTKLNCYYLFIVRGKNLT